MSVRRIGAVVLGAIGMLFEGHAIAGDAAAKIKYPEAPRSETVNEYHGRKIADAYRPLEDPDAPATRAWVEAENRVTFGFLESIPERAAIRDRLRALWDYEKYSAPQQKGGRYFYSHNTGLQNQYVLYTAESIEGPSWVLLDPNNLSADGTVALAGVSISKNGRFIAYGIAAAGSDWSEWKVREVATGVDAPRPGQVGQVLDGRVAARRSRLLLRSVPGAAAGRGPQGGELQPEGLLAPPGDPAIGGRPRLGGPTTQGVAG